MQSTPQRSRPQRVGHPAGFTLIELLVVIAIIALLVGILLPSLAAARRSARDIACLSNLKQMGYAIQMYADAMKDPAFIDVYFRPNPAAPGFADMTRAPLILEDNLGGKRIWEDSDFTGPGPGSDRRKVDPGVQKFFECPMAIGNRSVRDPGNIVYLQSGARGFYSWPPSETNPDQMARFSEYWVNDSLPPFAGQPGRYGVVGVPFRRIRHLDSVVWMTDALDEQPRHQDRPSTRGVSTGARGSNMFLFGDVSVRQLPFNEYYTRGDKYGSNAPFWNWGHNYPTP